MILNVLCANDGLEEFETPGRPGEARAKPMEDGPSILMKRKKPEKKKAKDHVSPFSQASLRALGGRVNFMRGIRCLVRSV